MSMLQRGAVVDAHECRVRRAVMLTPEVSVPDVPAVRDGRIIPAHHAPRCFYNSYARDLERLSCSAFISMVL